MNQHVLPPDLPDPARAYVESMPPGRVELFPLAALDRTGVACWNTVFLNDDGTRWHGVAPHGVGYGMDDAAALIGTTGELAEAVHSAVQIQAMQRRTATYAALSAQLGPRHVADPLTLCLPAGSPVDHDTTLEWVPAKRWPGGETVWLPIDIAACSVGDLSPGYVPFTTPITNGLGAGPTLDFAIGHGLCELLQRDGNGLGFRAMDRGIALDLGDGPKDPQTRAMLQRLADLGIDVIPKFADTEFGVANVYCVGTERAGEAAAFPIMVTAAGEAASLDREHALRKALLEFAAARVRKAFSHAPLGAIQQIAPPGYLDRFRAYHTLGGEETRTLREMVKWLSLDQPALKSLLADTVLSRRSVQPFDALPTWDGPLSSTPLVQELARRFEPHGMDILYCDWSPPRRAERPRRQGHRPRPRSRDHELPPHRRPRRPQAPGPRQPPRRPRRPAPRCRPRPPPRRPGRNLQGHPLARHRRRRPHRRPALPALPRTRGPQRPHQHGTPMTLGARHPVLPTVVPSAAKRRSATDRPALPARAHPPTRSLSRPT